MNENEKIKFIIGWLEQSDYTYIPIKSNESLNIIYKMMKQNIIEEPIYSGNDPIVYNYYGVFSTIHDDRPSAKKYFLKGCKLNCSDSMANLAMCYENMTEIRLGLKWLRRAIKLKNARAMSKLGTWYWLGVRRILPQSNRMAVKWYKQSAAAGDCFGFKNLADCYWDGCGVKLDRIHAIKLYLKSAEGGYDRAREILAKNVDLVKSVQQTMATDKKIVQLQKELARANQLIEHLKLFPGNDFEEAKRDFDQHIEPINNKKIYL